MEKRQLRLSSPPLALQILGLLLGGLVIAQAVTLFLTLVLPPQPAPEYGLDAIAHALTGASFDHGKLARPLQRAVEQAPPSPSGPGWLTSEQSRHALALLLRRDDADVQLYFFTPLPFAGVAGPTRRDVPVPALPQHRADSETGNPSAAHFIHAERRLPRGFLYADYQITEMTPATGGFPGANFPASGLPGTSPATSMPGNAVPAGNLPGGFPGGAIPGAPQVIHMPPAVPNAIPIPAAAGNPGVSAGAGAAIVPGLARGFGPVQNPAALAGPAVVTPQLAEPHLDVILPSGLVNGIFAQRNSAPTDRNPLPVKRPAPVPQPAPAGQTPEHQPAPLADVRPLEQAMPPALLSPPQIPRPRATSAPKPFLSVLPQDAPSPPRGLFGLAPAPFVEGYFIAALHLSDGRWAVVQPVPEPFPNSWQRRVLLWFAISFALVAPLGWLFARRLVRPIAGFATAAEQLGRDPTAPVMPLEGPAEVGRAAHAFNRMQSRLRSFVDDRTAMVGAISHDLRTPLTRLRFRIENVPDDLRDGMLGEVEEMEQMISSVLAFIRDASEPGSREMMDLRTLVEDVVEDAVFVGKHVTLEDSEPAEVEVDPLSMRRLLGNLVENAVKYGNSAQVRLFTDKQDAFAEVSDDGPGLPEDELERVFQPFYRAPQARASNKHGTGLGLAVCRSIARAHGGDVQLMRGERGLIAQLRVPLAFGAA